MNTIDYLDLIKSQLSITSDYQLAKTLGISRGRVSNYRTGRHDMDDLLAIKIEKLLNLKAGTVLIDVQASRTKCPEAKRILHDISQKLAAGALSLVLVFSALFHAPTADARIIGHFVKSDNNIHYAHNSRSFTTSHNENHYRTPHLININVTVF